MPVEKHSIAPDDAKKLVKVADSSVESRASQTSATTVAAGDEKVEPNLVAEPAVPVPASGTLQQIVALAHYMTKTEVHTYAFSVAAQVILSLFPFIVLLLTLAQRVFHSPKMVNVVVQMMNNFLPSNQDFVMRNMKILAAAHTQTRIFSVVMLLITTTGVFLPLEVALNSVWGVRKNRNYIHNQIVSLALATGVGMLAMASVALSTAPGIGARIPLLRPHQQHRLHLPDGQLSQDLRRPGQHRAILPDLLGAAESQDSCARGAADGHRRWACCGRLQSISTSSRCRTWTFARSMGRSRSRWG